MGSISELKTTVPFKFSSKSENSEGEVISNPLSSTFFIRYKVFVNGSEIDSGRVVADNWYKVYGLLSLIMLGVISYESIVNSLQKGLDAWQLALSLNCYRSAQGTKRKLPGGICLITKNINHFVEHNFHLQKL